MTDLHEKIRRAQVEAGERVVLDHLRSLGLMTSETDAENGGDRAADGREDCGMTFDTLCDRVRARHRRLYRRRHIRVAAIRYTLLAGLVGASWAALYLGAYTLASQVP